MNIEKFHLRKTEECGKSYKYYCSGCGACKSICPAQCIIMKADEEGFKFPKVKHDECINCGKCIDACQYIKNGIFTNQRLSYPIVYAAKIKNKTNLNKSSSGGISFCLANYIIDNDGIVYGVSYEERMRAKHIRIEKKEDLDKIQGSKYVQSELSNTFSIVKKDLESGKKVFFTGTPCQVSGLYHFLNKDYANLFTMDIICYGVPSPLVFSEYIKWEEQKNKANVININFRDKSHGWGISATKILFDNNKKNKIQLSKDNKFYRIFLSHLSTRLSCHNCLYTSMKRISDITVGDYWGINNYDIPFCYFDGVSKVIINTIKGKKLFEAIESKIESIKMPFESAIRPNLLSPPDENEFRNCFFRDLKKRGFQYCAKKYVNDPYVIKFRRLLRSTLNRIGLYKYVKKVRKKIKK